MDISEQIQEEIKELNVLKEKTTKLFRIYIKLTKVSVHEYSNLEDFVDGSSPDSLGGTNLPHFLAFVPRVSGRSIIHRLLERFKSGDWISKDNPKIFYTQKNIQWRFRNEKRFYDVAEDGLKRGMKTIERIRNDLCDLAKGNRDLEVVFKDIEFIHWILSHFNKEIMHVRVRRRVEKDFLNNINFRNYFRILAEIRHERRIYRKALKKVNPAKIEDTLKIFYRKSKGKLVKSGAKYTVYGLVSGAALDFITGFGPEGEVINFTFLLTILGIAIGIAIPYNEYKKGLFRLQEEAAVKMRTL